MTGCISTNAVLWRFELLPDALMALLFGLTTEGPRQITVVVPERDDIQPVGATIEDMPTLGGPRDVDAAFKAIHLGKAPQDVQVSQLPTVPSPEGRACGMKGNTCQLPRSC